MYHEKRRMARVVTRTARRVKVYPTGMNCYHVMPGDHRSKWPRTRCFRTGL